MKSLFTLFILISSLGQYVLAQNTSIPDTNFEQTLIDQGYDNVIDGQVPTANISGIRTLSIANQNITDLTGIDDFLALETLNASGNQIASVDLSSNTVLNVVRLSGNQLTSIDLPPSIVQASLDSNEFSSFTAPNLPLLEVLSLSTNQLTSVDPSNYPNLTNLRVARNSLTSLDVSQNIALVNLDISFNTIGSLDLSNNGTLTTLSCNTCGLNSIVLDSNPLLTTVNLANNNLTALDLTNNINLSDLEMGSNPITNIDLSNQVNLTRFRCVLCALTSLDVTNSPLLTFLALERNEITTVDTSQNPLLEWTWIRGNNLVSMNYSNNPAIRSINLSSNELTAFIPPPATNTLTYIALGSNQLNDPNILSSLLTYPNLSIVDLGNNQFAGTVPNLTGLSNLSYYIFSVNRFQFGDFENEHAYYRDNIVPTAFYRNDPQAKVDIEETINANAGDDITMTVTVSGSQNHYEWFKDGNPIATAPDSPNLILNDVTVADEGVYHCQISSDIVTSPNNGQQLILERNDITLVINDILPACTSITLPTDGSNDVSVDTNINWTAVTVATGYLISIGTSAGASDVLASFDNGNATTYNPPTDFEENTTYYVTITPYNAAGNATGCTEISFTTDVALSVPGCTFLTSGNSQEYDGNLTWEPVAEATGYRLNIGTSSGLTDVLDNFDNGSSTIYDPPNNLPQDQELFITIIPYNSVGVAESCGEEQIRTDRLLAPPPCTTIQSPQNGNNAFPVDGIFRWDLIPQQSSTSSLTSYNILLGRTPGGSEILDTIVGAVDFYEFPGELPDLENLYLTIIPYNRDGAAQNCSSINFTTGPSMTPPNCTSVNMPTNGATDVAIDTNISWNPSVTATGYLISIGTSAGASDVLANFDNGNATTYNPPADFQENTTYFVNINPYNGAGMATGCAETSFTTETLLQVPNCTSLIRPLDTEQNVPVDTDIEWNAVNGAEGYIVNIGSQPGTNDLLANFDNGNNVVYDPPADLSASTSFFITIIPYNAAGNATGCIEERFQTVFINNFLSCSTILTPQPNQQNVPVDIDLEWTISTSANGVNVADGYEIRLGTAPGLADVVDTQLLFTPTQYDIPQNLQENTTYYLQIIPFDTAGPVPNCQEITFSTGNTVQPPFCTTINTPADGAINIPIDTDITWNATATATGYLISIGTSAGASDILADFDNGNSTTYNPQTDFDENTTYFVNINPYNSAGMANGCAEITFTTEILPTPPNCTNIIYPSNGAIEISANIDIVWEDVIDATGYFLSLGTQPDSDDILSLIDVGNNSRYQATNLPPNTVIYASITPYNATGNVSNCSNFSFTTFDPRLVIPLFFTPNQDGFNDVWKITDPEQIVVAIQIFDRYGKLLTSYQDSNSGWNGTFNNEPMPSSDYWYLIKLDDGQELKGHFTLKR
ncbi:T9SS type B sorting domain-containing protein [Nonlabens agnitus]|uniref:Ig-like domain-containing protein n=1 Tax=Nonlabens agnitus TaxID=870484 RepID=A0A2S9WTG9_9FLAO|nr:T9SS type B sorting domain-containing protein [Nonlabens agnitus]PRP66777.1 hypothetical protein BST86_06520 [Nonlabens agnitus]